MKKKLRKQMEEQDQFEPVVHYQPICSGPEIVTIDDLALFEDDELSDRASLLENERNRLIKSHNHPIDWEVEIAYVRREQQIRKIRKDAHSDWLLAEQARGNNEDRASSN
jgi:hypothetical protein